MQQYVGEGGDSQVSDAVAVAEQLRREQPTVFALLSQTPVDWVDHANEGGRQYFKTLKMPLIWWELAKHNKIEIHLHDLRKNWLT